MRGEKWCFGWRLSERRGEREMEVGGWRRMKTGQGRVFPSCVFIREYCTSQEVPSTDSIKNKLIL